MTRKRLWPVTHAIARHLACLTLAAAVFALAPVLRGQDATPESTGAPADDSVTDRDERATSDGNQRDAVSPEAASLEKLVELLARAQSEAKSPEALAARIEREVESTRRALQKTREARKQSEEELEKLRRTLKKQRAAEETLARQLKSWRILLELSRQRLPDEEALATLRKLLAPVEAATRETRAATERSRELFRTRVEPIFAQTCQRCHNAEKLRGELDLTSREGALKGGSQGPALVPGRPEESLLLRLVRHEAEPFMPPSESKKLDENAVAAITEWIRSGAGWATSEEAETDRAGAGTRSDSDDSKQRKQEEKPRLRAF